MVLALAFLSYAWVLALPLTAIDTIPTIAASRIQAIRDLPDLLIRELRGGAGGDFSYYRPLTLCTYSVNYLISGWDPFGFHLLDLLLHALAVASVFWMARIAFDRGRWQASLVAALFGLHAAAIEVVPAVSRREEPILVIGFSVALLGARLLPSRAGFWTVLAGSLIAVTSVERGLVVPAVVGLHILLRRPAPAGLAAGLRRAVIWSLPSLAVALAFFGVRAALFGTHEIRYDQGNLVRTPYEFFLSIVYPQQLIELQIPRAPIAAALGGVIVLGVAALLLWTFWRSRDRSLHAFVIGFGAAYCLLFAIAGQRHPWYTYTAVPAFALSLVALATEAFAARQGRHAAVRSWLLLALCGVLALPIVISSPVFRDYPAWRIAGQLGGRFTAELERTAASLPSEVLPVIVNLPSSYRESSSEYLVTRSAAILWPRSVLVWCKLHDVAREIAFVGAADFVGSVTVPETEFPSQAAVRIFFPPGGSQYIDPEQAYPSKTLSPGAAGREFAWPPPSLGPGRPELFVFDGERLRPLVLPGRAMRSRPCCVTDLAPIEEAGVRLAEAVLQPRERREAILEIGDPHVPVGGAAQDRVLLERPAREDVETGIGSGEWGEKLIDERLALDRGPRSAVEILERDPLRLHQPAVASHERPAVHRPVDPSVDPAYDGAQVGERGGRVAAGQSAGRRIGE